MKKFGYKKILVGVLVFVLSFLIFKIDVNAYCTYEFVIESVNILSEQRDKKQISIQLNEGVISGKCQDVIDNADNVQSLCFLKDEHARSSLFINDNGKLYCPDKIYVNLNSDYSAYYSLASEPREGWACSAYSGEKCVSGTKYSSLATLKDTKINSYEYPVIEDANGKFTASCKSGWNQQVAEYDSWWTGYSHIINTVGATAFMIDEYNEMIADHAEYCGYKPDTEFQTKEKENYKIIEAKAAEDEETQEALKKLEETVVELEEKVIEYQMNVGFSNDIISCESLLDKDLKLVIQFVLKIIRIAVPILLIVLVTIDFASAVISNDQDAVKKAVSKTIKRVIAALAFFFVPLIVSLMLDWLVIYNGELTLENETIDCSEVLK